MAQGLIFNIAKGTSIEIKILISSELHEGDV